MIFLFQLNEKLPEPAQSVWNSKTEVEIRLVLADCVCGRPKLAVEKKTIGNGEKIWESEAQPTDSGDQAVFVDESNGKTDFESNMDSGAINVIQKSEGKKNDESELNVCQFWGNNWRQFTSVLPGLLLLLTLGAHNVFTIYELDHFKIEGAQPLLTATRNFYTNRNSSSSYDSSPYHSNYNSYRYNYYTTRRYEGYEYGSYSDEGGNRSPKGDLKSFLVIVMWFVGAIVGNVFGAAFVRNLKKRTIYVSFPS